MPTAPAATDRMAKTDPLERHPKESETVQTRACRSILRRAFTLHCAPMQAVGGLLTDFTRNAGPLHPGERSGTGEQAS